MIRLDRIRERILQAAERAGRNPSEIALIAVTKQRSLAEISALYAAGQRLFGESRVQEVLPKIAALPSDIAWHLIGNLQRKKVPKVVGKFALLHAIDSLELAQAISERNLQTDLLLEVNTSGEASKRGFSIEACRAAIDQLAALPNIQIRGLMTMAPLTRERQEIRSCFARLRQLRDEFQAKGMAQIDHLSMGMSQDFEIAIEEGATLLRIGTALFEAAP